MMSSLRNIEFAFVSIQPSKIYYPSGYHLDDCRNGIAQFPCGTIGQIILVGEKTAPPILQREDGVPVKQAIQPPPTVNLNT